MISSILLALVPFVSPAAPPQSVTLEGRIVDSARLPVSGARLFLAGQVPGAQLGEVEVLAWTRSGADGEFAVEIGPRWLDRRDSYKPLWVTAHAEGRGLFAAEWSPENVPGGGTATLPLAEPATFDVRVTDQEGVPVAGALVGATGVVPKGSRKVSVPEEIWRALGVTTGADGRATLPVRRDEVQAVTVWTDGRPAQSFQTDPSNPDPLSSELRLDLGRMVPVDTGEMDPAGLLLLVRGFDFYENAQGHRIQRRTQGRVSLAEAGANGLWIPNGFGSLHVVGGDARALVLEVLRRNGQGAVMDYREAFAEGALPTESVVVRKAETLFTFRGSVEDGAGKPLAGVELRLGGLGDGWIESGADGAFEVQSWANRLQITDAAGRADFAHNGSRWGPRVVASPDSGIGQFEPIRMSPLWSLTSRIVDGEGRPVGGAYIVGKQSVMTNLGGIRDHILTTASAEDGCFTLRGGRAGSLVVVSVSADGPSGPRSATVTVSEGQPPAEIELAQSIVARGRLRLLPLGGPAAGTALTLDLEPELGKASARLMSGGASTVYAAEDGTFRFDCPLDPDRRYTLNYQQDGICPGRSATMTGAEWAKGVEIEVQSLRSLTGRLIGLDGEPVPGAQVRLRSSALGAETDADGVFLAAGGAPGADVMLARTSDGQWHSKLIGAALTDLDWTLSGPRGGESYGTGSMAGFARERAIAGDLADLEFGVHMDAGDMGRALSAIGRLSWSEPLEVLRRVEEGLFGGSYRKEIAESYVARALTKSSPNESLAVSQRLAPDMTRVLRVLAAARELPRSEELECLALERATLRAIQAPEYRLVALAKLSERLIQIGRTDAAIPLLEEGKGIANNLPTADWAGYARATFGEVLALANGAAGLAMIESMEGDGDRDRHFGNVAHKLAAVDPVAAEEWVTRCATAPGPFTIGRFISRVAYGMAVPDGERALRLAGKHDNTGFSHGMIALALSGIPGKEEEAAGALGMAMERASKLGRDPLWSHTGALTAAALIPVAAAVDPEHLDGWVARALAVGLTIDPARGDAQRILHRVNGALSFYIAPLDRDMARALVEPALALAVPQNGSITHELRIVWAAYAVIDPEDAAGRAKEVGAHAMAIVADVLGRRGAERTYYVQTELLNLWAPGKEDI